MPDPILTYSYNELSDEIKQKITEKLWDINVFDDFWFEPTLDYWKEKLTDDFAISKIDIFFDLHRRDGTYFTGYVNDLEKFLKETKIEYNHDLDNLYITFTKNGVETPFMITQSFHNDVLDWKNQICSQIIIDLNNEWDYQTSKEAIEETIIANCYRFTDKGQRLW